MLRDRDRAIQCPIGRMCSSLSWRASTVPGACHQIGSLGCLGKRDAVANIGQPRVQHHQPVAPQGDSTMRGSAIAERTQQEAELFLGLLRGETEQSEDLRLNDVIMATNRAATAFLAVNHQVVSLGANLGRLGLQQVEVFEQRHGERMMLGDERAFRRRPSRTGGT